MKFVKPLAAAGATTAPSKPLDRRDKFYQYTAIDACTRLRIMKIYPRNNQKTAIQFQGVPTTISPHMQPQ